MALADAQQNSERQNDTMGLHNANTSARPTSSGTCNKDILHRGHEHEHSSGGGKCMKSYGRGGQAAEMQRRANAIHLADDISFAERDKHTWCVRLIVEGCVQRIAVALSYSLIKGPMRM